jgi:nitroreductase
MSALDSLIYGRRSIRKYKKELPPPEWIEAMVTCALQAPSPANRQPVRFFRIGRPETREKLRSTMETGCRARLAMAEEKGASAILKNVLANYYQFLLFLFDAPALFAVGTVPAQRSVAGKLYSSGILANNQRTASDEDLSVGLAVMEWMLKGEELGLGSCILTAPLFYLDSPEEILGVSPVRIHCFLTLGFPDETPAVLRKKNFSDIYREL